MSDIEKAARAICKEHADCMGEATGMTFEDYWTHASGAFTQDAAAALAAVKHEQMREALAELTSIADDMSAQIRALRSTIASQAKLLEEAQPYLHNLRTTAERHLKKDPTYDAYLIREVLSNTIMIEERLRAAAALHDKLKGA